MRRLLVMLWLLVGSIVSAEAQVSISIGINLPSYPTLVAVPGYPVYYAPRTNANYFFYDGMYWVYQGDNWYASSWYNGPWWLIGVDEVPLYVLRVPVRYYREPPVYFRGWRPDAPPRWGEHWGNDWDQRHRGWDQWDRRAAPRPAPLPLYQRQYSGTRYPQAEQQPVLQSRNYRYQPREAVVQQHFQARQVAAPPPVQARRAEPSAVVAKPPAARPPAPAAPSHQVRQPESPKPPREQAARQAQPVTAPHEQPARQVKPAAAPHEQPAGQVKPAPAPHEQPARQVMPAAAPHEQPARQVKPAAAPSEQHARPAQESAAPRGQQAQQAQPQRGEEKGRGKGEEKGKGDEKGRGEK
ncbi:MAG: hypothetical protein ACXWIQ_01730 [Caldimonas sp.]